MLKCFLFVIVVKDNVLSGGQDIGPEWCSYSHMCDQSAPTQIQRVSSKCFVVKAANLLTICCPRHPPHHQCEVKEEKAPK